MGEPGRAPESAKVRAGDPRGANAELGVVIPALDEAEALPGLLDDLGQLTPATRIVVVDGGSEDDTVAAARRRGASVLRSEPGRARQMNAGAGFLRTPWLLFLHADSRMDGPARRAAEAHVRAARREGDAADAACFDLEIDHPHAFYRIIEWGVRVRVRRSGLAYGDQGLLIPRRLFRRLGPFPDEPIMEDVILNRRLHRAGRLRLLPARLRTSPRRYEEEGRVRGWARNIALITGFMRGTRPSKLAPRYRPRRRSGGRKPAPSQACGGDEPCRPPGAVLLVFAKAPRPGAVKTRLAREIGDRAAADAYRHMGRWVVDRVTAGDHGGTPDARRPDAGAPQACAQDDSEPRFRLATVVCYAPPGAEAEVREWLGPAPEEYWPQPGGDLGARMAAMFERALRRADRAVVIGTDAPSVDARAVQLALAALDSADVVLGPAADGGYYLMGLGAPRPELFDGVPWSTDAVLAQTALRADAAGLEVTFLEVRADVDTAADLGPELAERLCLVR